MSRRSPPEVLNGTPLLERVEKMLRAPLKDREFELDGEETRRYLQFTNGVFDPETMTFVQNSPEIRVTNCTDWAWEGSCDRKSPPEEHVRAHGAKAWVAW